MAIILWSLEKTLVMLWQNGPPIWLCQAYSDSLKVTSKLEIASCLALKARGLAKGIYNS